MTKKEEKNELILSEAVRGQYLVWQANDLAKAFGKLTLFEHQILDYCISYVRKDDEKDTSYSTTATEVLEYLGLDDAGSNYKRLGVALKKLKNDTPLLLPIYEDNDPNKELLGVSLSALFDEINTMKTGEIEFIFSKRASPLLFDLKKKFYTFKLEELSRLKSKYSVILIKLWASCRRKTKAKTENGKASEEWKRETVIKATIEDWQVWLLGEGRTMEPSQFKRDCIMKGMNELNKQEDFEASLKIIKKGRKVIGYEMTIISDRGNDKRTIEGEVVEKTTISAPASNVETLDQFFDSFKKVTGVSATKGQRNKTNELVDVFDASERLPILNFAEKLFVEYGGKTYAYLLKVVEHWTEANLKTLKEVEAFYNAEKTGVRPTEELKSNVPYWSNPDYVNPLDPKIIDMLIEFHKLNGTLETPGAQAEIAQKREEIEQGRAELEARKWELLGKLDRKENL